MLSKNNNRYKGLLEILKCPWKLNEPLSNHTSFQVGGLAELVIMPEKVDEIKSILTFCHFNGIPFYLIGWGSNLLVSDRGFPGIIIQFHGNREQYRIEEETVVCEAGLSFPKLIQITLENNLIGLDFMYGIPGTIGGSTYMNAGTNTHSLGEIIQHVTALNISTLEETILKPCDLDFSYRRSRFFNKKEVILAVSLQLKKGDKKVELEKLRTAKENRILKQPLQYPNAGCIWKNPKGSFAGKLIENQGLKGHQCGGAQLSNLHANFIINKTGACASDIFHLMMHVEKVIYEKCGVLLEREIQLIGDFF